MTVGTSFGGKRELLARGLLWSGASSLLAQLPARDSLLVLNYHRIGNAEEDLFDPGVFSATAEEFDRQISFLKRHLSLVTLDEALAFIDGTLKEKTRRCRVLITFDDGYLDNYEIAFPILRLHGAQGVFFLATRMVGSCQVPWWDHIAYLIKTARNHRFTLRYPAELAVNLDKYGLKASLNSILKLYKMADNSEPERFILELSEQSKGDDPPGAMRRFLNWDEAREMIGAGMAIGSHTDSHTVLSQLEPDKQFEELSRSRAILEKQLGTAADVLAYPVGGRTSFTDTAQKLAQQAGYRAAFSRYGGRNLPGKICAYDVKRIYIGCQSWSRFRVRTEVCRASGRFWP
jgi:peptidoglycan/xylan/chitin deacetylase (PgdA/CDA1 family)